MVAAWKGDITEKDAAMTMLNNTSSHSVTPVAFRRSARFFIELARVLNGWVDSFLAKS